MLDQIHTDLKRAGFNIEREAATSLQIFIQELTAWNKKFNLTAVKGNRAILSRLVIPAISFSTMFQGEERCGILDFGSGAGFPGIPLKIACPEHDITLLDATGKKVRFLKHVSARLNLPELRCVNERGETFAKREEEREQYDIVVAMAVSDLFTLKNYAFPLLKRGGRLITLKGNKLAQELEDLEKKTKGRRRHEIAAIRDFSQEDCTPFSLISIRKCST